MGPSQRLGDPFREPLRLGSRIPWPPVAFDDHIVYESAVWFRVRPRPAETCSHPGSEPSASLPQNHLLERLGGFDQSELERLVTTPKWVRGLLDFEGVVDPVYECTRTRAAELCLQLVFQSGAPALGSGLPDIADRSDFVRTDNLVIINEENRHL